MTWLAWQLADSAFPVGGFAHSAGLESALQHGEVTSEASLERFLREALWQSGHGALPLASAAHADCQQLPALDDLCEAFLTSAVSNRASRTQGRALLNTCERTFPNPELAELSKRIKAHGLRMHHAPLWGAILVSVGVSREEMQRLFLYLALRSPLSAAIRLGLIGPQKGQQLQLKLIPFLEEVYCRCTNLAAQDLTQTAPLIELFQSAHDRLYSRLFVS